MSVSAPLVDQPESFRLAEGTKYACMAAGVAFLELAEPIQFDDGLSVHPGFHAPVPNHWHEWLGSMFIDRLGQKSLIIRATLPSESPLILDEEHYSLANSAQRYFNALMLFGARIPAPPILLLGSQVDGSLNIRHVSDLVSLVKCEGTPYTAVNEAKLRNAYDIYLNLTKIEATRDRWLRFSKGLKAIRQAASERMSGDRTHHWVRALEALLKTEQGKATRQFTERCQLFTGASTSNAELFSDAYNTRSYVEHMNSLDTLQKSGESLSDAGKRVNDQSAELEIITLEVYRRVLTSDSLLTHFETDSSMTSFWAQASTDRENAWGNPVDIAAIRLVRQQEVDAQHS